MKKSLFPPQCPTLQIQYPCSTNFCFAFFAQHFNANCNYQAWTRWKSVSSRIPPLKQNKSSEVVLVGPLWKPCRIASSVRSNKQSPFLLTEALWAPVLDDDRNRKNRWKPRLPFCPPRCNAWQGNGGRWRGGLETSARPSRGIQTCLLWRRFNKESRDCEIAWSHCSTHFTASLCLAPRLHSGSPAAIITIPQLKLLGQKCLFSPNKIVNY